MASSRFLALTPLQSYTADPSKVPFLHPHHQLIFLLAQQYDDWRKMDPSGKWITKLSQLNPILICLVFFAHSEGGFEKLNIDVFLRLAYLAHFTLISSQTPYLPKCTHT